MSGAKNIIVIGDLVIDHTVFVKDSSPGRATARIPVYDVVRRLDTDGGAATCARILAVLNPGHTFLWGLVGKSNWGDYRTILEHCQALDGAHANIKFRGAHDETNAQMNTITRLISRKIFLRMAHQWRSSDLMITVMFTFLRISAELLSIT